MPHRIENLRETLAELEIELAQVDTLDDESRRLLKSASAEIQAALQKEQAEDILPQHWTDHLSEAATEIEHSHPALSRLVGNVINALAQLGI